MEKRQPGHDVETGADHVNLRDPNRYEVTTPVQARYGGRVPVLQRTERHMIDTA